MHPQSVSHHAIHCVAVFDGQTHAAAPLLQNNSVTRVELPPVVLVCLNTTQSIAFAKDQTVFTSLLYLLYYHDLWPAL